MLQVEQCAPVDEAHAHGGHGRPQYARVHQPVSTQLVERDGDGHETTSDARRARAAVVAGR